MTFEELRDFLYEDEDHIVFGGTSRQEIEETAEVLSSLFDIPIGYYLAEFYEDYPYLWICRNDNKTYTIEGYSSDIDRSAVDRDVVLALVQEPVSIDSMSIL